MRRLVFLALLGCASSPPPPANPPPANTAPAAPTASALAGASRCHQAIDHMDQLATAKVDDPDAREARLQAIQQARAAGILGDDPTGGCSTRWTNAIVDCVLAATDSPTASACIPAT